MTKYLVEFEIISNVAINPNIVGGVLNLISPDGSHLIQIRNLTTRTADQEPILGINIVVDAESLEKADEVATLHLMSFLDVLALTFNTIIKRHKTKRVIDWTPGLDKRACLLYQQFTDPNLPVNVINEDFLKSIILLMKCDKDDELKSAMSWYRQGVIGRTAEESFKYFWFALEILAEREKNGSLVADKCPKCHTPLYCPTCQETSEHRPYPKQAIESLIKLTVNGNPDKFFDIAQTVRHALLHGESAEKIEKSHNIKFSKVCDDLGRVVWGALFNQLKKNLKEASEQDKFAFLHTPTFVKYRMVTGVSVVLTAPKGTDLNNPKIEDFPNTLEITMLVRETEEIKDEKEYKPI